MGTRPGHGPHHRHGRLRPPGPGHHRVSIDPLDYPALHSRSVTDLDGFWSAAAEFVEVRFHQQPTAVLDPTTMPGARWFPAPP